MLQNFTDLFTCKRQIYLTHVNGVSFFLVIFTTLVRRKSIKLYAPENIFGRLIVLVFEKLSQDFISRFKLFSLIQDSGFMIYLGFMFLLHWKIINFDVQNIQVIILCFIKIGPGNLFTVVQKVCKYAKIMTFCTFKFAYSNKKYWLRRLAFLIGH